jgi:hypothetical protein
MSELTEYTRYTEGIKDRYLVRYLLPNSRSCIVFTLENSLLW